MGLTGKQRKFIDEYLQCFNGTEAARLAGYGGGYFTLASIASENLKKPKIKAAIKKYWEASAMSVEEAISRLSMMAGGNIGKYISEHGVIDWQAVKRDGALFKEITHTKGHSSFKMHDAQAALVHILKHHGALKPDGGAEITFNFISNVDDSKI